jgi:hypothetical protein
MSASRLTLWLIGVATFGFSLNYAGAQSAATGSQTQERLATGGLISSLLAAPVVGEPYSAVQVHGRVQTLADGSTVSHHGHHFVARDAEGRVHVEVRMAEGRNGEPDTVMVFVMDPVAHTITTWLSGAPNHPANNTKVATVFKIPAAENRPAASPTRAAPSESARPQPIITTEDLGTKQIQGLEVSGKRTRPVWEQCADHQDARSMDVGGFAVGGEAGMERSALGQEDGGAGENFAYRTGCSFVPRAPGI